MVRLPDYIQNWAELKKMQTALKTNFVNFTMGFVTDALDLAGESEVLVDNDTQIFDILYRLYLLAFAL